MHVCVLTMYHTSWFYLKRKKKNAAELKQTKHPASKNLNRKQKFKKEVRSHTFKIVVRRKTSDSKN